MFCLCRFVKHSFSFDPTSMIDIRVKKSGLLPERDILEILDQDRRYVGGS